MNAWSWERCSLLFALAASVACGGTSERRGQRDANGSGGSAATGRGGAGAEPGAGGAESGGTAGNAGRAGSSGEGGEGGAETCALPSLPEAPLLRLTNVELDNTVRDVFGVEGAPSLQLPPDERPYPALSSVTPLRAEGYHRFAHDFALEATSDPESLETVTGCDVASEGEDECRRQFIDERVARVLRRPLDADDLSDFEEVFERGVELGGGFSGGVRAVLEVALQSPEFLYRIEFGEPFDVAADDPRAEWGRPTPFEMASRLSYVYWKSAPDDELVEAARSGGLRTREEVAKEAARLLADDRAKRMARPFYFELLRIQPQYRSESPPLTTAVASLLVRETEHFVDEATFGEPGTFAALLTSPTTWLNAELASYYGVMGVSGDEFGKVDLDPSRTAGILTQGSFLVTHASSGAPNPFRRGLAIYTALLCQELPAPPASVVTVLPPSDQATTNRERWVVATSDPVCAACHRETNAIGFAFEHHDQWGRWRDTDNGFAIDATGEISVTDAAGRFDGAVELARLISESDDAKRCFAGKWLTYAYGRPEGAGDACSRRELEQAFADGKIVELLLALSTTDAFLYRPLSGAR